MSPEPGGAVLLDTCTLLDLSIDADGSASRIASRVLGGTDRLLVSAASAWEIAIKTRSGRLLGGEHLIAEWDENLADLRAEPLDIAHRDALQAGVLDWSHRDPFDRMLVVQARRHGCRLATRDRRILTAGVVDTIDASG